MSFIVESDTQLDDKFGLHLLTDRQREVFYFIYRFFLQHQSMPTVRDIASAFQITVNGVSCHINALIKKDKLTRMTYTTRGLKIRGMIIHTETRASLGLQTEHEALGVADSEALQRFAKHGEDLARKEAEQEDEELKT
jgi:SOS-response transcriptional repressor LexA